MLSDSFQSIEWPFTDFSREELRRKLPLFVISNSYRMSDTKKQLLEYFFGIVMVRTNSDNYLQNNYSNDFFDLVEIMAKKGNLAASFFNSSLFKTKNSLQKEIEEKYFNFFCYIFASDIIPNEQILDISIQLLDSEIKYVVLAKKFFNRIQKATFPIGDSAVIKHFIYYLTLHFALYEQAQNKVSTLELFLFQAPKLEVLIDNELTNLVHLELEQFIREENINYLQDENTKLIIENLTSTFFSIECSSSIYIYIQTSKELATNFIISRLISTFFGDERVKITDDYGKADLIITDSFEKNKKK